VPIAQAWGGGLLASVDGLRFVVPVRTLNAGPSPKYFGYKRGLTWLNAVNDQVAGIGAQVVSGTPRDSLHILDVLLNLDAGPKPDLVATDEAAYSDMVFGVFRMLGYRFSPRISDIGDTRYWRAEWPADPAADYGSLNAIARNKVNLARIVEHWPDMLRVAGSLVTHQVRAYDVLRMLARDGRPTPLGAAFTEYGRIAKTLHLLAMIDPVDDTHRRIVNTPNHCPGIPARPGPQGLPRPTGTDPPGLPRRTRRPTRRVGHRRQRHHPVEHPLPGRRRHPTPRQRLSSPRRGRRPTVPARIRPPQRTRPIQLPHLATRVRSSPPARPRCHRGRPYRRACAVDRDPGVNRPVAKLRNVSPAATRRGWGAVRPPPPAPLGGLKDLSLARSFR